MVSDPIGVPLATRKELHQRVVTRFRTNGLINTGQRRSLALFDKSHNKNTKQMKVLRLE